MSKAFICYRRSECEDIVERLNDRLYAYFGADRVFVDKHSIPAGKDFRRHIDRQFDNCAVLLLVIGKDWLRGTAPNGQRQIDDPKDYVRIEVELALERNIPIIPILVHGATMPANDQVPESIRLAVYQAALDLPADPGFHSAANRIIRALEQFNIVPPKEPNRWEYVLVPAGIVFSITGGFLALSSWSDFTFKQSFASIDIVKSKFLLAFFGATLPLGIGPPLIVFGKRLCCQRITADRTLLYPGSDKLLPVPKSTAAVASLALGLASVAWNLIAAVPAIVLGIYAILDVQRRRTWVRGQLLAIQAIVYAVLGCLISAPYFLTVWSVYQSYQAIETAKEHIAKQEYEAAIYLLDQSVAALPNHGTGYLQRGIARFHLSNHNKAYSDLSKAIHHFERHAGAFEIFPSSTRAKERREYATLLAEAYTQRAKVLQAMNNKPMADRDLGYAEDWRKRAAGESDTDEYVPPPPDEAPMPAPPVEGDSTATVPAPPA